MVFTNRKHDRNRVLCRVTRLNISMQKKDSILLSHTGLRYYYKTDKKVYNEIKNKFLSKRWINSGYETQIKMIAHNIRNKHCTLITKTKRLYNFKQLELF